MWATWTVFGSLGRPEFAGTRIRALTVRVHGHFAYTTCVFEGVPVLGGERLACTNVLHRVDGEWKLVHHHADKPPLMGAILEKLAQGEDPAG